MEQIRHYLAHPASPFKTLDFDPDLDAVVVVILPGAPPEAAREGNEPPAASGNRTGVDDSVADDAWADSLAEDPEVIAMADYVIFSPTTHEPPQLSLAPTANTSSAANNGGCTF